MEAMDFPDRRATLADGRDGDVRAGRREYYAGADGPSSKSSSSAAGGIVVIHDASVANKPETSPYWKSIIGGSWVQGQTQWKEGTMNLYYVENERIGGGHPITKGRVEFPARRRDLLRHGHLARCAGAGDGLHAEGKGREERPPRAARSNVFDIQPQMWTYERTAEGGTTPYRAFVTIPGASLFDLRVTAVSRDPVARDRVGGAPGEPR